MMANILHESVPRDVPVGVQSVPFWRANNGRERAVRPIALHDFYGLNNGKHLAAVPLD